MDDRIPYQPRVLHPTTVGRPEVTFLRSEPPSVTLFSNQQKPECREEGGTGTLTFKDEDGAEVGKVEWRNGRMLTDGDQTIEVGKDDSSSPS